MLGSRAAAGIGRYDYLPDESGRPRGDIGRWRYSPVLPPTVSKAAEFIAFEIDPAVRLAKKADECFELGIAYFRNRDLIKARNYFERVRDLQRDRPRAFIADVFVAYDKGDYNRALLSLLRALERAETLEDLKLDRFIERLYKGDDYEEKQRAFKRTVESVNLFVNSRANAPLMKVLLAYYAWLNGDLSTAIAAAEIAAGSAGDQPVPQIEKFRKLLIEAKDGAAVPPPGT
jgi:tetratricopeptide (TPR) repeat protein